jgi:hypothetical protein
LELNDNFLGVGITKEGDIANSITGYGRFDDWANPIMYTATASGMATKYGVIEDVVMFLDIDNRADLVEPVKAELARRKKPYLSITGDIYGGSYPHAGDRINIKISEGYVFLADGRQFIDMTVTSAAYDPVTEIMSINASEYIDQDEL